MLTALIMAGGRGTRFWPLSTDEKPKQFLNLFGEESMIQMTVNRLKKIMDYDKIFIVTGKKYKKIVMEQIPELPEENIVIEPYGKNTAPCIALSAFHINKKFPNATIAVLPSDHYIKNENEFLKVIKTADEFVECNNNAIVTVGLKPDRAETGYGYINFGEMNTRRNELDVMNVNMFVEKPDKATAVKYLESGDYLWNGGMFIWKSLNILKLTKEHMESTFEVLSEIAATSEEDYDKVLEEKYDFVDATSIDYGIMEKAKEIYVIPSDFGWDDVGSWTAVERLNEKDSSENVVNGESIIIDSKECIVHSYKKPIVLIGVENLIVVETEHATVICKKDDNQRIKEALSEYKKRQF